MSASALGADRDGDGLKDGFETKWGLTSPDDRDSDNDGVVDSAEDNDRDGLGNLGEQRFGTDPRRRDSDGDGKPDGREDHDRDGRSNAQQQDRRPVPAGLRPSVYKAKYDVSPYKAGCQTTSAKADLVFCSYGPASSRKTIVLMGDSHAVMITSPIKAVAEDKGWRLTTLTKKACPPVLGIHNRAQRWIDDGKSCRVWRQNALDWLRANPPDLIILAHSDSYQIADLQGRKLTGAKAATAWYKGIKRTISAMPASSEVLVLGDIPLNKGNPANCLKKHPRNISACTTPREPARERTIEQAIRKAALAKGAEFRTMYGKICSYDPCPVIQGNVLMWRDRGHFSATFSDVLTPSYRKMLGGILGPASKRR